MPVCNFKLKNIPTEVMVKLKMESAKQKISVNSLILHYIDIGLGITKDSKKEIFHDLDHLAGTWNSQDVEEFKRNIAFMDQIDIAANAAKLLC